jgi:hypothetical protein
MLQLCIFLFNVLLFFVLTPGILFTIPTKSSKNIVALVHALVFATILYLTCNLLWKTPEAFYQDPVITYKQGQLNLKITSDWTAGSSNLINKINSILSTKPNISFITSQLPCTLNKTNQKCSEISKLILTDYSNNNIPELVLTNAMINNNNNQINDFLVNNGF